MAELGHMLRRGADVNQSDKDGWTALHHACRNNDTAMATELIRWGADVNKKNKRRVSPLHESAYRGFHELVSQLLAAGADVNAVDKDGWTPCHAASRQGYARVVELLVVAHADLTKTSRAGKVPRDYAEEHNWIDVLHVLDMYAPSVPAPAQSVLDEHAPPAHDVADGTVTVGSPQAHHGASADATPAATVLSALDQPMGPSSVEVDARSIAAPGEQRSSMAAAAAPAPSWSWNGVDKTAFGAPSLPTRPATLTPAPSPASFEQDVLPYDMMTSGSIWSPLVSSCDTLSIPSRSPTIIFPV